MGKKHRKGGAVKGGIPLWQWACAACVFAVLCNFFFFAVPVEEDDVAAEVARVYTDEEKEAKSLEMNAEIQAGMDMLERFEFDAADAHWKKLKAIFRKKEGVLAQMHDYKSASTEYAGTNFGAFVRWEYAIWLGHYQTFGRRGIHRQKFLHHGAKAG